ncbi:hypothetical protein CLF_112901 [Clonorchis sinensis]|uniref:Uncharacterized protein n=1 Tax=Clonorchis sinensis TaxID=79923 RepID=G7YX86_CLOSI|nr:hypothetical protein CLF_112901 [Clonorchis sinensis]
MLTQANLRRKKAGTISTGQLGDHVSTNTIIVVNSMVGYQASFRFTPLATFLTLATWEDVHAYRSTNPTKPGFTRLLTKLAFLNVVWVVSASVSQSLLRLTLIEEHFLLMHTVTLESRNATCEQFRTKLHHH